MRGLLALPVQDQVIYARLVFRMYREDLTRLHLALFSYTFAQASTNSNNTVELLELQHTNAADIMQASDSFDHVPIPHTR